MQDWILMNYTWMRTLHILSFVSWMAGLFYLPRLFVYHCGATAGSKESETFKVMERRLYKAIMNPAMVATFLSGGAMLWGNTALLSMPWIHVKLTAVFFMCVVHFVLNAHRKTFLADANVRPHTYYRVLNEVPTLLLIIIVIMAIVQPFSG